MSTVFKFILGAATCLALASTSFSEDQAGVPVLYPKNYSVVGNKVNVVIDPTDVAFFQIVVNKTEFPVVDTSTGAHAYQGLPLDPGLNTIIVHVLSSSGGQDAGQLKITASRSFSVFNRDGAFSPPPPGYIPDPFHTRERESTCGSCHRMEISKQDIDHTKHSQVLCYTCHRSIPTGRHIHGPAALWNCLSCHDADLYPAKYTFTRDPWKIEKSSQSIFPDAFTVPVSAVFKPGSAVFISTDQARTALSKVLSHIRKNADDHVLLEVHSDDIELKPKKTKNGKIIGFRDNLSLTAARAKKLSDLLRQSGINNKRIKAVGLGARLPKAPNATRQGREANNRIEVVVYPPDVKVVNSQKLDALRDRERVLVSLQYKDGPPIRDFRIIEKLPEHTAYVKGSGFLGGNRVEPNTAGNELIWTLGDREVDFSENFFYTIKKEKGADSAGMQTRVSFKLYGREQTRALDPGSAEKPVKTVSEACLKCHSDLVSRQFKHGPVDAGYCSICHDPHASPYSKWLRKPVWDLCTTCHADQGSGVHVVAGIVKGKSHPTKSKKDPARPGKRLSCSSCHEPHSSNHQQLLAYNVKSRSELCSICHKK